MLVQLRTLPRTVWLLGLISLLNDSASELVYPLVPLYLSSVLMAGPRALGLIEGLAEATASLLKLYSGVLVDRSGRSKPWVVSGYALAGLARPLIALAASWPALLVLRFVDRIAKGLRSSPRDALLAASISPGQRGLAFGLHRALDNAGAVIGPLLASLLLGLGVPLREVFFWALLPALLCVGLSLRLAEAPAATVASPARFDWRMRDLPPPLKRYLFVVAIFTLGNSSNMFLLLRAQELGVPQAQVPLLWAAVSAIASLFSAPLSALSDRLGRIRLLVLGYLAYALFYLGLGHFAGPGPGLYALFAFYGLFMAATEGVEKALVADLAPPDRRGTAFGWFNLVTGALLLPASLLFGSLYQGMSAVAAFTGAALLAGLAALLMATWVRLPR